MGHEIPSAAPATSPPPPTTTVPDPPLPFETLPLRRRCQPRRPQSCPPSVPPRPRRRLGRDRPAAAAAPTAAGLGVPTHYYLPPRPRAPHAKPIFYRPLCLWVAALPRGPRGRGLPAISAFPSAVTFPAPRPPCHPRRFAPFSVDLRCPRRAAACPRGSRSPRTAPDLPARRPAFPRGPRSPRTAPYLPARPPASPCGLRRPRAAVVPAPRRRTTPVILAQQFVVPAGGF